MEGTIPNKEGYLDKKSKGMFQRWRKRYFELKPPFLEYKVEKGKPTKQLYHLENSEVIYKPEKPKEIKIDFGKKRLTLWAKT